MTQQRGPAGMRVLHGLLSQAGKHPVATLEKASQKALHHGPWLSFDPYRLVLPER